MTVQFFDKSNCDKKYMQVAFEEHFRPAIKALCLQAQLLGKNYFASHYQLYNLAYPFMHFYHGLLNIKDIIIDAWDLMNAAVFERSVAETIAFSLLLEIGTLVINALNVLVSALAIITRNIATLLYGGYALSLEDQTMGEDLSDKDNGFAVIVDYEADTCVMSTKGVKPDAELFVATMR